MTQVEKANLLSELVDEMVDSYRWDFQSNDDEFQLNLILRSIEGAMREIRTVNAERMNRIGNDFTQLATAGHIPFSYRD